MPNTNAHPLHGRDSSRCYAIRRNSPQVSDFADPIVTDHNRQARSILLDSGALALSKDVGAHKYLPQAGYGYVCDARSLQRLGSLAVDIVYQEHGVVKLDDEAWFERLPVGSLVRVLPNHTCMTCAAFDAYEVVRGDTIVARWARVNGW